MPAPKKWGMPRGKMRTSPPWMVVRCSPMPFTDKLGAAVGASVGTLIPALHDAPVLVVPSASSTGASIDVSLTL